MESGVERSLRGEEERYLRPEDIISAVPSSGWARGISRRAISSPCCEFTLWNLVSIRGYTLALQISPDAFQ